MSDLQYALHEQSGSALAGQRPPAAGPAQQGLTVAVLGQTRMCAGVHALTGLLDAALAWSPLRTAFCEVKTVASNVLPPLRLMAKIWHNLGWQTHCCVAGGGA